MGAALRGSYPGNALHRSPRCRWFPESEVNSRDPGLKRISENKVEFLIFALPEEQKPEQLKVNATELTRRMLSGWAQRTAYALTLSSAEAALVDCAGATLWCWMRQQPQRELIRNRRGTWMYQNCCGPDVSPRMSCFGLRQEERLDRY